MGVASCRVDVKQAAARAERWLERVAEPLATCWQPADAYPAAFLDVRLARRHPQRRPRLHLRLLGRRGQRRRPAPLRRVHPRGRGHRRAGADPGARRVRPGRRRRQPHRRERAGMVEAVISGDVAPPHTQQLSVRDALERTADDQPHARPCPVVQRAASSTTPRSAAPPSSSSADGTGRSPPSTADSGPKLQDMTALRLQLEALAAADPDGHRPPRGRPVPRHPGGAPAHRAGPRLRLAGPRPRRPRRPRRARRAARASPTAWSRSSPTRATAPSRSTASRASGKHRRRRRRRRHLQLVAAREFDGDRRAPPPRRRAGHRGRPGPGPHRDHPHATAGPPAWTTAAASARSTCSSYTTRRAARRRGPGARARCASTTRPPTTGVRMWFPLPEPADRLGGRVRLRHRHPRPHRRGRPQRGRPAHVPVAPLRRRPAGSPSPTTACASTSWSTSTGEGDDARAASLAITLLRCVGLISAGPMAMRALPAGPPTPTPGGPDDRAATQVDLVLHFGGRDPYAVADEAFTPLLTARFPGRDGPRRRRRQRPAPSRSRAPRSARCTRRDDGRVEVRVVNTTGEPATAAHRRPHRRAHRPATAPPTGERVRRRARPPPPPDRHHRPRRRLTRPSPRRTRRRQATMSTGVPEGARSTILVMVVVGHADAAVADGLADQLRGGWCRAWRSGRRRRRSSAARSENPLTLTWYGP